MSRTLANGVPALIGITCVVKPAPRTLTREPTGKLYKRLLRDRYWQGRESKIV